MKIVEYLRNARTPRSWTPYLILSYGLFLTIISSYHVAFTSSYNQQLRFHNRVALIEDQISDRMDTNISLLLGARGYFDATPEPTAASFAEYVESVNIEERFNGVQGIGYVPLVRFSEKTNFEADIRRLNNQPFSIYPNSPKDFYFPILYLEPQNTRNREAIGYDMFSEETRREAMSRARDTGLPAASKKVQLVQEIDENKQAGFLIYVPVYSTAQIPTTVSARQTALRGFVYSPYRVNDLITNIVDKRLLSEVEFSIHAGDTQQPDQQIFSSLSDHGSPKFEATRNLEIAGLPWQITFHSSDSFEQNSELDIAEFIFVVGTLTSFLLFALSNAQYRARSAVEQSAIQLLQSEHALQETNQRMVNILESITDGFITLNENWKFTYVNKEGAVILGHPPKKLLGKNIWEVFPTLRNNAIGELLKKAQQEKKPSGIESFFEPLSVWLSVRVYPSKLGLSVYFHDVTKRKELERQKDEFIGIASHELKTPVTSIKAYNQVLQKRFERTGNTQAVQLLEKMDKQIDKLSVLINDLLDVTKIEAGKLKLNPEHFVYQELVAEVVEEMQRTTDKQNLVLNIDTDASITADRYRIGQVLVNLLSNAIKYSPLSDTIIISVSEEDDQLLTTVQDFGVGISLDKLDKIFERFYRVGGDKQETYPGLGLGLYISAEIIRRHHGTIWVESTKGDGSLFHFTLPIHPEKPIK